MWNKIFFKLVLLIVLILPSHLWGKVDTAVVDMGVIKTEFNFNDLVPAQGIYPFWDTTQVDPYNINVTENFSPTFLDFVVDDCAFNMPITGITTSRYGWRRGRMHRGIDLDLNTGDSVACVFDGLVRISEYSPSFGNFIVVRHYNGLETLYAHLSQLNIRVGEFVTSGQNIGLGGNTGHSRGSHLHFEVRFLGKSINPELFFDFENGKMKMESYTITKEDFTYVVPKSAYAGSSATKYHTIRNGENLGSIARKYRTTVSKLCKLNKIRPTTIIRAGKKLRVR